MSESVFPAQDLAERVAALESENVRLWQTIADLGELRGHERALIDHDVRLERLEAGALPELTAAQPPQVAAGDTATYEELGAGIVSMFDCRLGNPSTYCLGSVTVIDGDRRRYAYRTLAYACSVKTEDMQGRLRGLLLQAFVELHRRSGESRPLLYWRFQDDPIAEESGVIRTRVAIPAVLDWSGLEKLEGEPIPQVAA